MSRITSRGKPSPNRQLIMDCLPGTSTDVQEKTNLCRNCVWVILNLLVKENKIYAYKIDRNPLGGKFIKHYKVGPKPYRFVLRKPEIKSDIERRRAYVKRLRKDGEWDERLAKKRSERRIGKPDPLMAMYGTR